MTSVYINLLNRISRVPIVKKYSKQDQKLMAAWAADCAKRVLPLFEREYPRDDRPRKAIKACRAWVRTGVFRMADIRGASLAAHTSARAAQENEAACFAARAAGQAVATAHVPQHAYGGAYYALKAVQAANPENAEAKIAREWDWQSDHLPEHLRRSIMSKIVVQKQKNKVLIKIRKDRDY
jgi:hypothetical protein